MPATLLSCTVFMQSSVTDGKAHCSVYLLSLHHQPLETTDSPPVSAARFSRMSDSYLESYSMRPVQTGFLFLVMCSRGSSRSFCGLPACFFSARESLIISKLWHLHVNPWLAPVEFLVLFCFCRYSRCNLSAPWGISQ